MMRRPTKSCPFCETRVRFVDYKDDRTLGRFITEQGKILRTPTVDIRIIGRATQGVRLMDLDEGDKVVSVALVEKDEEAAPLDAAASGSIATSTQ